MPRMSFLLLAVRDGIRARMLISWKMAYAKPDFSGRRFCDARAWALLNHFYDMSPYLDWALGKDPNAKDMPLGGSKQEGECC